MNPLRIAVVGAGAYDSSRSRAYQATITKLTDFYILCAICDRDTQACRAAAEAYGIPALYTDVEDMIQIENSLVCVTKVIYAERRAPLQRRRALGGGAFTSLFPLFCYRASA